MPLRSPICVKVCAREFYHLSPSDHRKYPHWPIDTRDEHCDVFGLFASILSQHMITHPVLLKQ